LTTALKKGINYIDTAAWYGHGLSEKRLGIALKNIPRKAYYIASKACRYQPEITEMFDFSFDRTLKSIDESLERLGIEYLDVIQIHDMEFSPNVKTLVT
jgi:aryl-alcohol dehydrogenase-like predicted oxidoreductase